MIMLVKRVTCQMDGSTSGSSFRKEKSTRFVLLSFVSARNDWEIYRERANAREWKKVRQSEWVSNREKERERERERDKETERQKERMKESKSDGEKETREDRHVSCTRLWQTPWSRSRVGWHLQGRGRAQNWHLTRAVQLPSASSSSSSSSSSGGGGGGNGGGNRGGWSGARAKFRPCTAPTPYSSSTSTTDSPRSISFALNRARLSRVPPTSRPVLSWLQPRAIASPRKGCQEVKRKANWPIIIGQIAGISVVFQKKKEKILRSSSQGLLFYVNSQKTQRLIFMRKLVFHARSSSRGKFPRNSRLNVRVYMRRK